MKKRLILAIFSVIFLTFPLTTKAGFDFGRLIDPACFFACENKPKVVNTTVNNTSNSNNVNSNINSNVNSPDSNVVISGSPTPVYVYENTSSNNNNNNNEALGVSCYATNSIPNVGDTVIWRASTYGGNGNYNITWSGTNGLSGSGSSATITYNSSGSKTASVQVISGGQTISRNCSSIVVYQSNNNNYDDYYNDYDYNNNYSGDLGVSCYPSRSSANIDDNIIWRASVYGGNGNYRITWSGSNNLSDTGTSASIRYSSRGTKTASVRVTSGGQSINRSCGSVVVYDDYNRDDRYDDYNYNDYDSSLKVSCSVSTTFAPVGTRVTWNSYASGGSGSYRYEWYGSDSIRGSNRDLEVFYNSPGTKTAYVVVRSGSRSITQTCSNSLIVGTPIAGYTAPVYTPPTTIVKYVETPTKAVVAKAETSSNVNLASLFSLQNIPWGLVAILVIIVLIITNIYLIFFNKKQ